MAAMQNCGIINGSIKEISRDPFQWGMTNFTATPEAAILSCHRGSANPSTPAKSNQTSGGTIAWIHWVDNKPLSFMYSPKNMHRKYLLKMHHCFQMTSLYTPASAFNKIPKQMAVLLHCLRQGLPRFPRQTGAEASSKAQKKSRCW